MTKSESLELNSVQVSRFQAHLLLNVEHTCLCANWPAIQKHMSFCLQVVDDWFQLHNPQSSISTNVWLEHAKNISSIISGYVVEKEFNKLNSREPSKGDKPSKTPETIVAGVTPPHDGDKPSRTPESVVRNQLKTVLGKIGIAGCDDANQEDMLKKIIGFSRRYFRNFSISPSANSQIFTLAYHFMDWLTGNCEVCKAPPSEGGWRLNSINGKKFEMKGAIPSPDEILARVGDNLRLKEKNYFARDKLKSLRQWFDAYHYWLHHIKNDPLAPRPGHHKPYVNASAIENVLIFDRVISAFLRIIRSFNATVLTEQLSLLENAEEKTAIELAINSAGTYECFRDAIEQLPLPTGVAVEERRIQLGLVWLFISLVNIVEPKGYSNKGWLSSFAANGALFLFDVLKQGCQSYSRNKNACESESKNDIEKIVCSDEQEASARLLFAFMSEIAKLQAVKSAQDLPAIITDCLMPIEVFYDAVRDERGGLQLYSEAQFQAARQKHLKIKNIRAEKESESKKLAPHLREYFFELAFHDLIGRKLKKKKPVADVSLVMEADANEEQKTVSPAAIINALKTRYLPVIYEYRFAAFTPSVGYAAEYSQWHINDDEQLNDEQSEGENESAEYSVNPLDQLISAETVLGQGFYTRVVGLFNQTFESGEERILGGMAFWLLCELSENRLLKDFVKKFDRSKMLDESEKLVNLSKLIDQAKSNSYITDEIFLRNITNYCPRSDEKELHDLLNKFEAKFPAEKKLAIGYTDTLLSNLELYKSNYPEVFENA